MKYAFVTVAILAVWVGVNLLALRTATTGIFLPIFAIVLTLILFMIGFGKKI